MNVSLWLILMDWLNVPAGGWPSRRNPCGQTAPRQRCFASHVSASPSCHLLRDVVGLFLDIFIQLWQKEQRQAVKWKDWPLVDREKYLIYLRSEIQAIFELCCFIFSRRVPLLFWKQQWHLVVMLQIAPVRWALYDPTFVNLWGLTRFSPCAVLTQACSHGVILWWRGGAHLCPGHQREVQPREFPLWSRRRDRDTTHPPWVTCPRWATMECSETPRGDAVKYLNNLYDEMVVTHQILKYLQYLNVRNLTLFK